MKYSILIPALLFMVVMVCAPALAQSCNAPTQDRHDHKPSPLAILGDCGQGRLHDFRLHEWETGPVHSGAYRGTDPR